MINLIKSKVYSKFYKLKNIYLEYFKSKPKILTNEETIDKIVNDKCSIGRFGDGEFFVMTKEHGLSRYQEINNYLCEKLLQVINSNEENFLVGIPKVFDKKDLEFRTDTSKEWWINYLSNHRALWYKYINFNKIYANTCFTRNYIVVKDKSGSKEYFDNVKRIWEI